MEKQVEKKNSISKKYQKHSYFPHSQADKFLKMTQSEMGMYKDQRHIMFLMGNDFHYAKAKQV